jgi:hypothetical protein
MRVNIDQALRLLAVLVSELRLDSLIKADDFLLELNRKFAAYINSIFRFNMRVLYADWFWESPSSPASVSSSPWRLNQLYHSRSVTFIYFCALSHY